jgi:predicted TPR repeat methyltransferase
MHFEKHSNMIVYNEKTNQLLDKITAEDILGYLQAKNSQFVMIVGRLQYPRRIRFSVEH